jgi:hypothetical protein
MSNKGSSDQMRELYQLLDAHPEGVLALMYWVKYHEAYRVAFHRHEADAMKVLFGISERPLEAEILRIRRLANGHLAPNETEKERQDKVVDELAKLFEKHVAPDLVYSPPGYDKLSKEQPDLYELLDVHPDGILSLMYWVRYHAAYGAAFGEHGASAMSRLFGIHDDVLQKEIAGIYRLLKEAAAAASEARTDFVAKITELFKKHVARELMYGHPVFW